MNNVAFLFCQFIYIYIILYTVIKDKGSGIAIEVVPLCHRKSEHVRYYKNGMF